jgi:hypothetical protein
MVRPTHRRFVRAGGVCVIDARVRPGYDGD